MGQLSQLVLLASILARCISYSIDSTKSMPVPEPPVEPSKSDFLEYPIELMDKLIASLSPEQLKKLQPIDLTESNLVHRDGNTDITACHKDKDIQNYQNVEATDGLQYFVLDNGTRYQNVTHYVCNDTIGNKCEPAEPEIASSYCCRQGTAKAIMQVVPAAAVSENITINELSKRIVEKEIWMNSDCICNRSPNILAINNPTNYSCPKPEAIFRDSKTIPFS